MSDNSGQYSGNLRYAVDIVLCVDTTESMRPVLENVKSSALSFHDRLSAVMAEKGKSISQLRLKVIAFRDFGDRADDALEETRFFRLPDDASAYEDFVRKLEPRGGGDAPESGLEALALAIRAPWERGLDRRRHVIVVFTDAPAHPLRAAAAVASGTYPQSIARSEDELFEEWGYQSSQSAMMENSAKRLLLFAPDLEPWEGIAANWNNTIHFPSEAGDGLEEWEMDEIIETIVNSL
jgi:von Willebrand factor type A domain